MTESTKEYLTKAYALSSQWTLPGNRGSWKTANSAEIKNVAVIGGGTMGRGIAIALSLAGYDTLIVENDEKAAKWCSDELQTTYQREKKLKRFDDEMILKLTRDLRVVTDLQMLSDRDLIIEAVFENMQLKKELFSKLDKICKKSCIFGTNTSSLDIDQMSSSLRDPSRLVGIHFFNPAHVLKTVEIVFGAHTSSIAVATAFAVCVAMQKVAVLVGNCEAFVFNRLLSVYLSQAEKLTYQYGMTPQQIDDVITRFGFLMGPLTMADMNGLDVMEKLKTENNIELNDIEKELLGRKRYGRKTGKGFYKYDDKTHKKQNDSEVEELIRKMAEGRNTNIQIVCDKDLIDFLLLPMVNEGFLCIEEGMISHESLIDIMFTFGFGWPRRHGGPMRFGREIGLANIAEKVGAWHSLEPTDRCYRISKTLKLARNSKI